MTSMCLIPGCGLKHHMRFKGSSSGGSSLILVSFPCPTEWLSTSGYEMALTCVYVWILSHIVLSGRQIFEDFCH